MPCENHGSHENHKIPYENNKNHENHRIPCENHKIIEFLEFQLRIMSITENLKNQLDN